MATADYQEFKILDKHKWFNGVVRLSLFEAGLTNLDGHHLSTCFLIEPDHMELKILSNNSS